MANHHTIQRATIDLLLPNSEQVEISTAKEWCTSVLLEELDVALSERCPEDQVLVMSTLQLDLIFSRWNEPLRSDQKNALRQQIRQQLAEQTAVSAVRMPLPEYRAEILLRYLQSGTLPDIYTQLEWSELKAAFQEASQKNRPFQERLLRALIDEAAFRRWLSITDEPERYMWLDERVPIVSGSWQEIILRLQKEVVGQQPEKPVSVAQLLQTIIRLITKGVGNESATVTDSDLALQQAIRTENNTPAVPAAGLVLVANFLPAFLRTVGLLDAANTFVSVRRVPMLLYCLATGETEAREWQLVLPKLLCGLPFSESCDTSITLSEQERQEINNLLTDVIDHWKQLKTTTPDGLRATFLQRVGRLTEKDAIFTLTIAEQTVDILLSFVPWSFRYVRFSWMPKLLITEWGNKA